MTRAIRDNARNFAAILLLVAAALAVGGYVLANQRVRFPFIEDAPFRIYADLQTAQAVTPGQGQTVRVSGIRIGDIASVELRDGRARVGLDIDDRYRDLIHTDATALLRPKTGLKDMFLEITPGSDAAPIAKQGWTLPVANTLPDVNPDEIFAALDSDTRDYLRLLVNGAGTGLDGRGGDLQEVFERFEPTHRDLAKVSSAVAVRRANLRRLIHSLGQLNGELAGKDEQLSQLVDSSAAVFRAFASEGDRLSAGVRALPAALQQTTATLRDVEIFARTLGPAADAIRPAARALTRANTAVQPFANEAAPELRDDIRPFVRSVRPLVRDLRPASQRVAATTPDLTRSFVVLNHLFNTIGYNPKGTEGPSVEDRQEGYLFWIAWLSHQAVNLFSGSDANGVFRPLTLGGTCSTLEQLAAETPGAEFVLGLTPILTSTNACG